MFGCKKEKQARMQRMVETIRAHGEVSQSQLARDLGVSRQTVFEDLTSLHEAHILVCEHRGKISLIERWFPRGRR